MPQNGHVNGQLHVPVYIGKKIAFSTMTDSGICYLCVRAWRDKQGPTMRMRNIAHTPQRLWFRFLFSIYLLFALSFQLK